MSGLAGVLRTAGDRFTTNISTSVSSLSIQQWIRLVAAVGAYLLLRPYLIKLGQRLQMRQHERDEAVAEESSSSGARISPNEIRGQKVVVPDSDEDGEAGGGGGGAATGADWGKKARRRQRHMVKKLLAEHERRLQEAKEEEEDKDIEEFLVG